MHYLGEIPQEILENIAFFTATADFLGPPVGVIGLLTANHRIHSALSISSNPHLWTRVFAYKFDLQSTIRRLGAGRISAVATADELKRRCILLKRIRSHPDTLTRTYELPTTHVEELNAILWMAYLMMLENEGKNEAQLCEYARLDLWLREYLFHALGASLIRWSVRMDMWPPTSNERNSLAMWLFWFLLKPEDYMVDDVTFQEAASVLKIIALGAHMYPLCFPSWRDFTPTCHAKEVSVVSHFSLNLRIVPPRISAPAILAYLTLTNRLPVSLDTLNYTKPAEPTLPSAVVARDSKEWDAEWARGLYLGSHTAKPLGNELSGAFLPGSLEGIWEGVFTYTEFTSYAALLSGASPGILQRSHIAQHPHLWRVREYHLYDEEDEDEDFNVKRKADVAPLSAGNPLRGYIPSRVDMQEVPDGLEFTEPGRSEPITYWRCRPDGPKRKVKDVFITGEGHSSWGQFKLIGRVRPCDGFISLSKEYVDSGRGKWVYRAYIVGNANGNLSGRWRDTLSPPDVLGYEGCFIMSRRR
ncbi:hypothetical protein BKA93DRAFT_389613 [Sparassis latifolia]|uniref:F-box domain-containing protein n=1 Tax=Sparassis crispa TaxID=139825 RepID=A0A401GXH4_9APHY|nr:hypothetical protein SCP_1001700 [Sparassis crispa]GBE86926.1 hypothetical protein SCP_1001700 [Sparassis crispa]